MSDKTHRDKVLMDDRGWLHLDIVFDGPPSHESGRFVEVEDHTKRSVRVGEWIEDGALWRLRLPWSIKRETVAAKDAEIARLREEIAKAVQLLTALQYSERDLGDGCDTCGWGSTVLKECAVCGGEEHTSDCGLAETLAALSRLAGEGGARE